MRSRVRFLITPLILVMMLWAATAAVAQTGREARGQYDSEIGFVVGEFLKANKKPVAKPADSAMAVNPFGGPVGLEPEATAPFVIEMTQTARVNFGMPQFIFDGSPPELGRLGPDGTLVPIIEGGQPEIGMLPSSLPGAPFGGTDALFGDAGIDPLSPGVQLLDGRAVVIASHPGTSGNVPLGDVTLRGASVAGSLPLDNSCGGSIIEFGFVDVLTGAPTWPADFAPNDIFKGGSQALVTRCTPGQGWHTVKLVNQGSSWQETSTRMVSVVHEVGFVSLIRADELDQAEGFRTFVFATAADNPYQSDSVAFFADPLFPDFTTAPPPFLLLPAFADQAVTGPFPFTVDLVGTWEDPTDGSSGCNYYASRYSAIYEIYRDANGALIVYDVLSDQTMEGVVVSPGGPQQIEASGSGEGFTTSLTLTDGSAEYRRVDEHGDCPYEGQATFGFDATAVLGGSAQPDSTLGPEATPEPQSSTEGPLGGSSDGGADSAGDDGGGNGVLVVVIIIVVGGVATAVSYQVVQRRRR